MNYKFLRKSNLSDEIKNQSSRNSCDILVFRGKEIKGKSNQNKLKLPFATKNSIHINDLFSLAGLSMVVRLGWYGVGVTDLGIDCSGVI